MKEPHEDVVGQDRTGDILMESEDASSLFLDLTSKINRATLVGNPAPLVAEMRRAMDAPRIGDRVAVADAIYSKNPDTRHKGVGYLVEMREEWASTEEDWRADELDADPLDRPIENRAYYIQYGPNAADICRWTNCSLLAI